MINIQKYIGRVKGITFKYAAKHIDNYKKKDKLRLVLEPTNPYDSNAIAIYDNLKHHIGYISKDVNYQFLDFVENDDYLCEISNVYYDSENPSIEFILLYDLKKDINRSNSIFPIDVFQKLSKFFNVKAEKFDVTLTDGFQYIYADIYSINCSDSTENNDLILIDNINIIQRHFIDIIPDGYRQDELFIAIPFDTEFNDSFNEKFVDYCYDELEMPLRRQYNNVPLFFENLFGQIHVCIFFDENFICRNNNIDKENMGIIFTYLKILHNEVVYMINNDYINVYATPKRRNPYSYDDNNYDYDDDNEYGSSDDYDSDPYGRDMFPEGPEGDDMLEEWFSDADD